MQESVKKILRYIVSHAKRVDDVAVIWLYGSQAKNTAEAYSDIDLAIAFNDFTLPAIDRKMRPEGYALEWAAALGLPEQKLSVVDINLAPVPLAENVVNQGKVIFCRDSLRQHAEEQRVWSLWEAFQYEHERNRKAISYA